MASDSHDKKNPSNEELLSSAKLIAEAAQKAMNKDIDSIDKKKVAGAAADLLGAASHYGKFDEKGIGKYLGQAEEYLEKFSEREKAKTKDSGSDHSPKHHDEKDDDESGGFGKYLKMAKDFLGDDDNSPEHHDDEDDDDSSHKHHDESGGFGIS